MKNDTILVLCAHNDDQIIGVGGTLAKYAKQGKPIIIIIFSYGESSHPHYQKEVIIKTRVKESIRADKILCGDKAKTYYLGLTEGKFQKEIKNKKISQKIEKIIRQSKPSKIFTHSIDDPHPDHKAVNKFVMNLTEKIGFKGDVYSFNVWNLFINLRKRNLPKLVVDISDTFKKKIEALEKHKSQAIQARLPLTWSIYFKAIIHGFLNKMKYAEVFYKIK
ncbi:PIG-L family deacetylase [Candidatus Woesearchaeota archaeon]|nr:PIG-L family deacetylase [Candidatus Woesearchaeota archaeon]